MRLADRCSHPAPLEHLYSARDYISGDAFSLLRCASCGLICTSPQPAPTRLTRYYPPGYYGRDARYGQILQRALRALYANRARRFARNSGQQSGLVVDIGCGRGETLLALRELGWRAIGTEISEASARYAREVLHLDMRVCEDVGALGLPEGSVDLVLLWHVLEHVRDPARVLGEIATLLRPGGTLIVAVPNAGSLEARLSGPRWFHLDVPRHLWHFTPIALSTLLRAEGLEVGRRGYFSPEYDFFSVMQTALNMFGIRQNTLYNLLRTRGAKVLHAEVPSSTPDRVASVLLAPFLGVLSLLWVPIAALSREGATMVIIAKRPES